MLFLFLLMLSCYVKSHIDLKKWKCPIFEKLEGLCDQYSKKSDDIKFNFINIIQSNIMALFSVPINNNYANKLLFIAFERLLKDFLINNPTEDFFHCRLKGKKITEKLNFIEALHLIQTAFYLKNSHKSENISFQFKKDMELEYTRKQFDIDSTFFLKQIKSDVAFMLFDTCMTNEIYFELLCNFVMLSFDRANLPINHVYIVFVLKLPDSFKTCNWLDVYFVHHNDIILKEKNHHRPFVHSFEYIYEPKQDYNISIKNFTIVKRYIYNLNNVLVCKIANNEDFTRSKINVAKFLIFTINIIQVKHNKYYFDCIKSNRKNFLAEKLYKIEILAFQISYKIFICITLHRMNSLIKEKNLQKYLGRITIYSLRNFKSVVHLRCYFIFEIGADLDKLNVIQEQDLNKTGLKYQQNMYNNFIIVLYIY
ncbi:hypothetical protein COBT_001057 [Conglomerata obtusa]